jgi:hypothetical protein
MASNDLYDFFLQADAERRGVVPENEDLGTSPEAHQFFLEAERERSGGDFTRGIKKGVNQLQGSLYGAAGLAASAADKVGLDNVGLAGMLKEKTGFNAAEAVRDWGLRNYERNMEEAARYPTKTLKDIGEAEGFLDTAGTAVDWVQGAAGQIAPSMVEAAVGAIVGSLMAPGPGTAAGGVASRTILRKAIDKMTDRIVQDQVKKGLIKEGAEEAAKKEVRDLATRQALKKLGGRVGMGAAVFPMEAGGNYAEVLSRHGVDAPATAALTGALATSLEFLGGNVKLVDQFVDAVAKGVPSSIKRSAVELLKNIPAEAMQEAGQESLSILNTVVNTDEKFLTPEHVEQIVESAAVGGVGGGIGAGAQITGRVRGRKKGEAPVDFSQIEDQLLADETEGEAIVTPEKKTPTAPGARPGQAQMDLFRRWDAERKQTRQAEVTPDAERLRKDERRIQGAGLERPGGEEKGRPDMEQPAQEAPGDKEAGKVEPVRAEGEGAAVRRERKPIKTGARVKTYLPDNTEVEAEYAAVEAGDLAASHDEDLRINPTFPADLQPRDRGRDAMRLQVQQMAQKLNPERLGESASVTGGAPIIGEDMVVESGNGRVIAIRKAYRGDRGKEYRQWLEKNAERFGLDAADISGMSSPVLVRVRKTDVDRADFARRANQGDVASMGPAETAKSDAERIRDEDMTIFAPSEEGDITAASNRPFMGRFLERIGLNEAAGFVTRDGRYTKQLVDRVKAAIFHRAYENDDLVTLMAEEADPGVKNVLNALTVAAPRFVKAKAADPEAYAKAQVPGHIAGAVRLIKEAKDAGFQMADYLRQTRLFGDEIPQATKEIALFIDQNKRSAKRMGEMFRAMADELQKKTSDQGYNALPGMKIDDINIEKIVENSIQKMKDFYNEQPQGQIRLFGAERDVQAGRGEGESAGRGRAASGVAGAPAQSEEPEAEAGREKPAGEVREPDYVEGTFLGEPSRADRRAYTQASLPFGEGAKGRGEADPSIPPPPRRVVMRPVEGAGSGKHVLHRIDDAVSLLSFLQKDPQESAYTVATDKDGNVLEIHRYSRGTKSSAKIFVSEIAGPVFDLKDAANVYFVHNHPSGGLNPSQADMAIDGYLRAALDLADIEVSSAVMGKGRFREFTATNENAGTRSIRESVRKQIPAKERAFAERLAEPGDPIPNGDVAAQYIADRHGKRADGFLYMDTQNRPVGFLPFPKGKGANEIAKEVIRTANKLNGSNIIVAFPSTQKLRDRSEFLGDLNGLLHENQILDIIAGGKSLSNSGQMKNMFPHGKYPLNAALSLKLLGPVYQRKSDPFYSELTRTVEAMDFKTMPPKDLLSRIKKSPGVKQEEIDWSGIESWLNEQEGKVSKDDVLEYLAANNIQIEEVEKKDAVRPDPAYLDLFKTEDQDGTPVLRVQWSDLDQVYADSYDDGETFDLMVDGDFQATAQSEDEARRFVLQEVGENYSHLLSRQEIADAKFSQYQLPGGENYREVLLTMPVNRRMPFEEFLSAYRKRFPSAKVTDEEIRGFYNDGVEIPTPNRRISSKTDAFSSPHWDEPNVLAHVRFNERTGPNGERILFLEEIQSDWHQEGRKRGYKSKEPMYSKEETMAYQEDIFARFDRGEITREQRNAELDRLSDMRADRVGVPDAPFKTTWPQLVMKRMVRYAAENGFDMVAWTPGSVQAERYDLSKQVGKIVYTKDGTLSAYKDAGGPLNRENRVIQESNISIEKLSDYIGKEGAEKLLNNPTRKIGENTFVLEGDDLKVGGEGMKAFYDKMLPAAVNKFFNKGKWGKAKVGTTIIPKTQLSPGEKIDASSPYAIPAHALPITPQMREKALSEGMPLFQQGGVGEPEVALPPLSEKDKHRLSRIVRQKDKIKTPTDNDLANYLSDAIYDSRLRSNFINKILKKAGVTEDALYMAQKRNQAESEKIRDARQAFRKAFTLWGIREEDNVLISGTPVTKEEKAVQKVAKTFGADLYFFKGKGTFLDKVNGVTLPWAPKNIYISKQSDHPFIQVAGHELIHTIRRTNPELYKFLDESLRNDVVGFGEYLDSINKRYREDEKLSPKQGLEELYADFVGDQMMKPEFWDNLANQNPTLTQRLAQALHEIFKRIKRALKRHVPESEQYFKDVQRAQDVVVKVLNEASGVQGSDVNRFAQPTTFSLKQAVKKITDNPNFRKWFGDSKVVDENGEPLVVYHGAKKDFSKFKQKGLSKGFFFSESPNEASQLHSRLFDREAPYSDGANVFPVYLSIENPMMLEGIGWDPMFENRAIENAKQHGHDGLILKRGDVTDYVAFEPTQIKSIFNTGAFDAANPDIMYQRRQLLEEKKLPSVIEENFGTKETSVGEAVKGALNIMRSKEGRRELSDEMVANVFDQLHPIKKHGGEKAYVLHRLETGSQAVFAMLLEHGKLVKDKSGLLTMKTRNEGFLPFLQSLGDDGHKFLYWVAAKRAASLEAQGRERRLDAATRKKIFDWAGGENNPKWMAASKKLHEFNKSVLDVAEASGLIDPVARKTWEQFFYVPFYRVFEDEQARSEFLAGPHQSKKFISSQIRQLKGSEKKPGDPLENLLRNWMHLISESMRNEARAEAVRFSEEHGTGMIERLDKGDILRFRSSRDKKVVFVTKKSEDNVLSFMEGGQTVYFKVNDPAFFQALANINTPHFDNIMVRMMGKTKRWLTYGATFGPAFRVANMLRDTLHTSLMEESFKPFMDTAIGFWKAYREDPDFVAFMAAGGGFGSSHVEADNPQVAAKFVRKIVKNEGKDALDRILDTPAKMLNWWERVGAASENAARVRLYQKLLGEGQDHMEAAFRARDLLDFTMRGRSRTVQFLIQTVPFLNARMQGLYKLGKAASGKETRRNFFLRGALLAVASMALWAWNKDKEEYKSLEDWDKWTYYHFWVGDKHFRIPKPFEVGAIFSSFPETLLDALNGNTETKKIAEFIGHTATETFSIGLPQIFRPMVEQWANRSAFTDRPIVGQRLEGLPASEQHDPWTSETLQAIGDIFNLSPKRAEHLVNGYFATLGRFVLAGPDILLHHALDFPEDPTKRIEDYPAIGRFVKEKTPQRYTRYQTWFYDTMQEMDKTVRAINKLRFRGETGRAVEMARDKRDLLLARSAFSQVRGTLSRVNREMRRVLYDKEMGAEEKAERINELYQLRNDLVKRAYEAYRKQSDGGR